MQLRHRTAAILAPNALGDALLLGLLLLPPRGE